MNEDETAEALDVLERVLRNTESPRVMVGRRHQAKALLRALRIIGLDHGVIALLTEGAVAMPVELTDEMRMVVWHAQYHHARIRDGIFATPLAMPARLAVKKVGNKVQAEQDRFTWEQSQANSPYRARRSEVDFSE